MSETLVAVGTMEWLSVQSLTGTGEGYIKVFIAHVVKNFKLLICSCHGKPTSSTLYSFT